MMKYFLGQGDSTNYILYSDFIIIKNSSIYPFANYFDLNGSQLFVHIDIRKLRTTDFVNKASFLICIDSHSSNIRFKLYETQYYNFIGLEYNDINQNDLVDSGIVYDTFVSEGTLSSNKILLEFDITNLMNKAVKNGDDYLCFRIISDCSSNCLCYHPILSSYLTNIVNGFFTISTSEDTKYDEINLNDLVSSKVNIRTKKLKLNLPIIKTKTKVCDLFFSGCIANSSSGLLGEYAKYNYEYFIRKDSNNTFYNARYIITNYQGIESYYILLKQQEILDYGIETLHDEDVYFNINDCSYIIEDEDYLEIHYNDGLVVYFYSIEITTINRSLYIHHIDFNFNRLLFIYSNNKLDYICADIDLNNKKYIEYGYSNGLINKVFFNEEKTLIKLEYNTNPYKLRSIKIYKALSKNDVNENNIISSISITYLSGNVRYLYSVTDNITNTSMTFNYSNSNTSNEVSYITHDMGVGDSIYYSYDDSKKEATITNKYNEYIKTTFNDLGSVLLSYDKYNNYVGYLYNKTINNTTLFSRREIEYKSFNIIDNSKFENGLTGYLQENLTSSDVVITNSYLSNIIGSNVLKLTPSTSTKKIYQNIQNSGNIGDSYSLSMWVKGVYSINIRLRAFIEYYNLNTSENDKTYFDILKNTSDYQLVSGVASSKINYDLIKVGIEYNGLNDTLVGNIRCYKEEKGTEYVFNNEDKFDSLTIKGDVIEYRYDGGRIDRITSSTGDTFDISYGPKNNITNIKNINTYYEREVTYDDFFNTIEVEENNDEGKETKVDYEYDNSSNLVVEKDERDFYTFNTYNNYNELIHTVYPSGLARKLEYGSYGNISKSIFMLNEKIDGASFTYDAKNRLKEILISNNTKYEYAYDSNNRKSSFSFINGNNVIPIINYGYNKLISNKATDLITEKKYFNNNNDKYNFTYNDKRQLTNIKYSGINRFDFSYDDSDRLSCVNDVYNDLNTYLTYDNNDNLICREIHEVHDDVIFKEENHYDNDGNIQSNVITCDGKKRSYDYDYINEYSEYNLASYLSKVSSATLNDYVSSVDAIPMYGEEVTINGLSIYYDNTLKRNIMRFPYHTMDLCYSCSSFNQKREEGKNYFGNVFNKDDWTLSFSHRKGIFGWFRFSSYYNINKPLFWLSHSSSTLYQLYISNNYLYIKKQNVSPDIETNLQVEPNEWNLIGLNIEDSKITVILNDSKYEYIVSNTNIGDIDTIDVCHDFNNLTTDILYLNIGPYFYKYNFNKIYLDGINYLSGFKVNKKSATMYYNHKAYESCDVIPLNGSFISRDGVKPVSYIFTNPDFTKDKTKLFMYDEETHRHVYASYSSYKTYCGETHSSLAYQFPYGTSGTLSMWFKLDSGTYTENRYIFSIQKSSTFNEVISCYIGADNKLYVSSPNNSTYSYNISNPLSWNFVSIIWSPGTLKIGLNGNLSSVAINSSINATNSRTFIGHKSVYYNITNNHLQGKIQLISYKDDAITDDELFDIEDYGYLIDVRKEYDNDDRLIKRSINTLDNSLNTTYAYFEDVNSNKLNRLPSNEIDYNNIKTIYAYDEDGNIIEKRVLNGNTIKEKYLYEYNELKQLKKETHYRENNQFDYSYEYDYNINGNRTKVTSYDETESILSEDEYTYSNIYKDRLESVTHNNTSLYTFSYQGSNFLNPSSIAKNNNTKFLSWHGRRLTSIGSTSFNYNESGIRIRKDNTNDETSYYINSNNKVLRSNFIDINHNNYIIDYHYDENGSLIGFHYDGKEYFYKKDILGIINEIIDEEGTPYVYYKYTAYGIPTSSINTNLSQNKQLIANILLNHNIYIYKDYIYDRDIDMYYLNSRYYDPYIGRFISIDAIEYLDFEIVNGLNLYAYCGNNPVMYSDPEGTSVLLWALLITAAVFIVSGAVVGGISAGMSGGDAIDILEGIGKGATNGLIIGGAFSLIAGGFVIGSETSIGSLMISYGISVSSNMLEVGVIQGKKSYYEGDGFWDVANDINKAMFSNSGSILIGKPFLFSKPLYGTRVISKVPTIANIFLSFEVEKMFADVSFFTTTKATLLSQASPLGLYISYGIATYQINKLLRAIAEKPDFNNSKWVLY